MVREEWIMRKILGLCFAVMLLVCVLGALGIPAFAETLITQLGVSGVTPAVVGETATTEGIVCNVPGVTVNTHWHRYDYDNGVFSSFSGQFREGEIYMLEMKLEAAEGYAFDPDSLEGFTVNGGKADFVVRYWGTLTGLQMYYFTREVELIDTVQIVSMPTLTPGQPMTKEDFLQQIRLPEDANYRIRRVDIVGLNGGYGESVLDGAYYECLIELVPKEGYWWDSENMQYIVPAENQNTAMVQFDCVQLSTIVDGRQVVESVTLNVPTIQPGAAATLEGITVSGGTLNQNFSLWIDANHQPVQVLEDDELHLLNLVIDSPEGYRYQDGVTQVQVNGLATDYLSIESNWITVSCSLDFRKIEVSRLELNHVPEYLDPGPVPEEQPTVQNEGAVISQVRWLDEAGNPATQLEAGKSYVLELTFQAKQGYQFGETVARCNQKEYAATGDKQTVKVSIPYTITSIIKDMSIQVGEAVLGEKIRELAIDTPDEKPYTLRAFMDDVTDGYWDIEDVFEPGHYYMLTLELTPEKGYRFSMEYQPVINGKEEGNWSVAADGSIAQLRLSISFLYPVEKVELPAFPELKAGDVMDKSVVEPEGASYMYATKWSVYKAESDTVVEDKGHYLFWYQVVPAEGYGFTEDTVFTVGGVPMQPQQRYERAAFLMKAYSIGGEVIDTVALELPPISIGGKPGEVQVPESAPYQVEDSLIGANTSGDHQDSWAAVDTYQEGNYHYLQVILSAAEGFAFDYPPVVTVNGKKMQLIETHYYFDEVLLVIGFGKLTDGIPGDADGDGDVDIDDAIYLLQHVLMPEQFPVEGEPDVDGSGAVTVDDAIYLLQHVLMPDQFPLK